MRLAGPQPIRGGFTFAGKPQVCSGVTLAATGIILPSQQKPKRQGRARKFSASALGIVKLRDCTKAVDPYSQNMRTLSYLRIVLLCALGILAVSSLAGSAFASGDEGGTLVIHRAANLGEALILSVDGKRTAIVRRGEDYSGPLSPGEHVISAILAPNELHLRPTEKRVKVEKGRTYTFIAAWRGDTMILE